jgi:hypothetical protein
MKNLQAALILVIFSISHALAQDGEAAQKQREEAAAKLAQFEIPKYFSNDMVIQISQSIPSGNRAAVVAFLKSDEMKTQLARTVTPIIAKHFTLEEIETMYRLSSSEIGRSIQQKQSAYYGDIMSVLERDLGPILDRFMRQNSQSK